MMKSFSAPQSNGFTLIEILVVLAVIAVLAAILLTVFSRVRENGRWATCQSNLHQIGLALQQYISDNNGFYPSIQHHGWTNLIQPYLRSNQVFDCPSHTERYPEGQMGEPAIPQLEGDYIYNWRLLRNSPTQHWDDEKSENLMSSPQETAVVFDAGWVDSVDSSKHYLQPTGNYGSNSQMYYYGAHGGGANFLFADGHVKWLSTEQQTNLPYLSAWIDPLPGVR